MNFKRFIGLSVALVIFLTLMDYIQYMYGALTKDECILIMEVQVRTILMFNLLFFILKEKQRKE